MEPTRNDEVVLSTYASRTAPLLRTVGREGLQRREIVSDKNESSKITKQQSWNFGPNISNCKSVMFVASFFAKKLKLKIKVLKKQNKIFKPETHLLRLNNTKSKKVLKCNPKWNLIKTLNKILEWNQLIKNKKPRDVCETQIKEYLSKK